MLIFDGLTSHAVDLDFRGSVDDVLARLPAASPDCGYRIRSAARAAAPAGRNSAWSRARSRLLPRHWEWLARQPGGASVAIRKLVEEARRGSDDKDRIRAAQEAAYRFMSAMAGNQPHFEEAIRALFAPIPAFPRVDRRMAHRCARPCRTAGGTNVSAAIAAISSG